MRENPNITVLEIAETINTTARRINYYIKALKQAGIIERVGSDKNGRWVVR
jgi:predicted HTH transcriptional regulator